MDMDIYREALLRKRAELIGGTAAKPLQWTMENNSGRQGDMADQASGNNEVHIQLKLKQTDAKILQAIEEALGRVRKRKQRRPATSDRPYRLPATGSQLEERRASGRTS
jgi:RNA polymerase-binding transcription factor DksA